MRLIDADELIKCLEHCIWNDATEVVNAQPTAYDVEKVVAKLEEKKELHTEHYNNSIYKYFPDVKQRYEQIQLVIDKIINIVRNGGKE